MGYFHFLIQIHTKNNLLMDICISVFFLVFAVVKDKECCELKSFLLIIEIKNLAVCAVISLVLLLTKTHDRLIHV